MNSQDFKSLFIIFISQVVTHLQIELQISIKDAGSRLPLPPCPCPCPPAPAPVPCPCLIDRAGVVVIMKNGNTVFLRRGLFWPLGLFFLHVGCCQVDRLAQGCAGEEDSWHVDGDVPAGKGHHSWVNIADVKRGGDAG